MSITFNTSAGDTFEDVARKSYGTENEAHRIREANPGTSEPFIAGVVLVVPSLPSAPTNAPQQAPTDTENETAVLIEGVRFRFWSDIRLTRSIDAMDTMEINAPFDANDKDLRETFKPLSFKKIDVTVGGAQLFTGTMVGVMPVIDEKSKVLSVNAYSLPAVLGDCTAPASAYPIEFNKQNIRDIAIRLAGLFGIAVVFNEAAGAVFERVALGTGESVLSFLTTLAKQRNLIISSTSNGELLFLRSTSTNEPVARLKQGESPLLSVIPFFSPQEYYSHITGIEPVSTGLSGSQFTVKNSRLEGVVRPLTFVSNDAETAGVKESTESKAGRMFGNAVTYSVNVITWRDTNGELWAPNSTVTLTAPDAMVYEEYSFIIRSVEFKRDAGAETAVLNLVIPGAFSGEVPEVMPWD